MENIESHIPSEEEVVQDMKDLEDMSMSDDRRSVLEKRLKELERKSEILDKAIDDKIQSQTHEVYNDARFKIHNEIGKVTAELENL